MKFDPKQHTHIALSEPRTVGSHLPKFKVISAAHVGLYEADLKGLLNLGETINVEDKSFYVISDLSVNGRKYGNTAFVRKTLRETAETARISDVEKLAKQLLKASRIPKPTAA